MLGILEIHETKSEYLPTIESDNWLNTFDDGLYSQYLHCKDISGAYFFINPTIINYGSEFISNIDCSQAHNLASKNDFRPYMSIPQIWELSEHNIIGLHGFKHSKFTNFGAFKNDFEQGIKFFEKVLGLQVTAYCFPYNYAPAICKAYLESLGIEVFGEGRIPVESVYGKNSN